MAAEYKPLIKLSHPLKFLIAALTFGCTTLAVSQTNTTVASKNYHISSTKPGTILSAQVQQPGADYAHAGQRFLINYRSRGVYGEPIVASGFIILPKGKAPRQGWPVLAWAHGTTGVADTCAPSEDYAGGPVHSYQQVADAALDTWLARGYAIVAPDYQGLGTPGGHPYMNATSQLHTVVDAVRALHVLMPGQINKQWLVMGHSQGGAAALAVAAYGQKDAPELNLKAALALAPGGYQYEGIAEYAQTHPKPDTNVAAFFPIVLLGAQVADLAINPDNLVSPEMQLLLDQGRKRCLSEMQTELKQSPDRIFKPEANLKPLLDYLKLQSIERMTPTVPLMLVQGTNDQLVDPRGTYAYYQQVCKAHKPVVYHSINGGDHRDAVRQSPNFSAEFLKTLNNGKIPTSCSTR